MTRPASSRKIAHYWYSCGHQIQVFVERRKVYILDEHGQFPPDPVDGGRDPYPGHGTELADASYETLGLYYDYGMAGTGWDGDC